LVNELCVFKIKFCQNTTDFWDPKNVHFHLMYLKRSSVIGLMMAL